MPAAKAKRLHRGDIMSRETRSAVMSRIKGRDTKCELAVGALLRREGIRFDSHARDLAGRPDFVLRCERVVVFVDGDFWHGWRFSAWRLKLSEKWEEKIEKNIQRDRRNFQALRRAGWRVVRIWEHQVERSPEKCLARIRSAMAGGSGALPQAERSSCRRPKRTSHPDAKNANRAISSDRRRPAKPQT
jgi:DNA mismatch endonuclease (patch repair protein)